MRLNTCFNCRLSERVEECGAGMAGSRCVGQHRRESVGIEISVVFRELLRAETVSCCSSACVGCQKDKDAGYFRRRFELGAIFIRICRVPHIGVHHSRINGIYSNTGNPYFICKHLSESFESEL